MRKILPFILLTGLLGACVENPTDSANQTNDVGADFSAPDMDVDGAESDAAPDMPDPGPEGWEVTTIHADPQAGVQLVDTLTPRVVTLGTEGDFQIINLATGDIETLPSAPGAPGVIWNSKETEEFVIATKEGDTVQVQAWRAEKEEFAPFGGPVSEVWVPSESGNIGYAQRTDGSLAMLDFVDQSALILDGSFGDGAVLDVSPNGMVLYRRAEGTQVFLFDPITLEKRELPFAETGEFLSDDTNIILIDDKTAIYNFISDVRDVTVSYSPSAYERYGRYLVIHYSDSNDVFYDLETQNRLAVGDTITVPENPWSEDGRYFTFSARGVFVVDSTTNDLESVTGVGTIREVIYRGQDSEFVGLTYEGSQGPRLIVYDMASKRSLFNDAMIDVVPGMPSIITADTAGDWWGFIGVSASLPEVRAYDRITNTVWTLGETRLTRCGLSMSADGTELVFPALNNGEPVLASWKTGADSGTLLASNLVETTDCTVPSSLPDHSLHLVAERKSGAEWLSFLQGTQLTNIVQAEEIVEVEVLDENYSEVYYSVGTLTSARSTLTIGIHNRETGESTTIDTQLLRYQPRTQFEEKRAYRVVPQACGEACRMELRIADLETFEVESLWKATGTIHSVFHNAVIFQGADPDDDELELHLMLARELPEQPE